MRTEIYIFSVIATTLFVSMVIIISYGVMNLDMDDDTTMGMAGILKTNAGKETQTDAIRMRDFVDHHMEDQYTMVETWASNPAIIATAKIARNHTKEQLFEMWSAQATRKYDDKGMAQCDGDMDNDLNPAISHYLAYLSKTKGIYPEIFFTDYRGYVISTNNVTSDFDQGPDDWGVFLGNGTASMRRNAPTPFGEGWYAAANNAPNGLYVSELKWDDSAARWGLEIVSQIRDPVTNEYEGQLKVVFDYGKFIHDRVNDTSEFNINEIELIDNNGVLVATSEYDQSGIHKEDFFKNMIFFNDAQSGRMSGYTYEKDDHGGDVLIGYAVSSDVNKHIVIMTTKESEVYAPINRFLEEYGRMIALDNKHLRNDALFVGVVLFVMALTISITLIDKKMRAT